VGAIFVDVWRLFKARFIDPHGPDVSRLATFVSASADAADDALGREDTRYVHNARDESHALEDREADGTRAHPVGRPLRGLEEIFSDPVS